MASAASAGAAGPAGAAGAPRTRKPGGDFFLELIMGSAALRLLISLSVEWISIVARKRQLVMSLLFFVVVTLSVSFPPLIACEARAPRASHAIHGGVVSEQGEKKDEQMRHRQFSFFLHGNIFGQLRMTSFVAGPTR